MNSKIARNTHDLSQRFNQEKLVLYFPLYVFGFSHLERSTRYYGCMNKILLPMFPCINISLSPKLRKECPYSELFWSVFSPNAGKYGPKTPNTNIFHAVECFYNQRNP